MSGQEIKCHPGLAAVFSFIFTGLGQIYNGQIVKGLVIILLSAVCTMFFIIGSVVIGFFFMGKLSFTYILVIGIGLFISSLFLICLLSIYSIFDAYKIAAKK